jgi:hypothetical protein
MKTLMPPVTLLCAAVVAAGCAAAAPQRTTTGQPRAAATDQPRRASTGQAAPASPAGPRQPRRCPTESLRIVTAPGSGEAMGTVSFDLAFTNVGSAPCTLYGYPGVSFTTARHAQIGESAVRARATPDLVVLAPGRAARAQVQIANTGNLAASSCQPTAAAFIRVFPPGSTVPAYVSLSSGAEVCAAAGAGTVIRPVATGHRAGA